MKFWLALCLSLAVSLTALAAKEAQTEEETFKPVKIDVYLNSEVRSAIKVLPILYANFVADENIELTLNFLKDAESTSVSASAIEQMAFLQHLSATSANQLHQFVRCLSNEIVFENCEKLTGIKRDKSFRKNKSAITKKINERFLSRPEYAKVAQERPFVLINNAPYGDQLYLGVLVAYINGLLPETRKIAEVEPRELITLDVLAHADGQVGGRDYSKELAFLKRYPFLRFRYVNPGTDEGKALIQQTKADRLPFYVGERSLAKTAWAKGVLEQKQGRLAAGNLALNIETESKVLIQREAKPNEITLYVMSQCPYGVAAIDGVLFAKEVGLLDKNLKLNLKYIVMRDKNGKLRSLKGDNEIAENQRQIAIQRKFPHLLEKYLKLRNRDYKSNDWETVATEVGIDVAVVKSDLKNAAKILEREHLPETEALKISASPTILWENQILLGSSAEFTQIAQFDPVAFGNEGVQRQVRENLKKAAGDTLVQ